MPLFSYIDIVYVYSLLLILLQDTINYLNHFKE